jgi:hypothetical protein
LTPVFNSDASSSDKSAAKNDTSLASKDALFQLTTETGAVWTSKDGAHWRQQ